MGAEVSHQLCIAMIESFVGASERINGSG